jgi:hypothetical protein
MPSPIGSKRNVKIFVLYLLENINYPLEYCTINDIVMQTDYVMFLDFAESFNEMVDGGLIDSFEEDGLTYYQISEKGKVVAQAFKSDVLSSILDAAMTAALRYLDFTKRGILTECRIESVDPKTGKCNVYCSITEKKKVIFEATLVVDSLDRARRMKANFDNRPEVIYRGFTALMAGNVNFLFD